jgi:small subunit ribosomal protein S1
VEDVIHKGEEVTAKVIKVDSEHKKIALSIKEYLVDKNKYNRDDIVVGTPSKRAAAPKKKAAPKKGKAKDEDSEETTEETEE